MKKQYNMNNAKELYRAYRFSFSLETMTIFLHLQKWFVPALRTKLLSDNYLMQHMQEKYHISQESYAGLGMPGQPFGHQSCMQWRGETEREITYSYQLFPIRIPSEHTCMTCGGVGYEFVDQFCYACHGSGKEYVQADRHFSEMLLSLYPLNQILETALMDQCRPPAGSDGPKPDTADLQHMTVSWSATYGIANCHVTAWLSDELSNWITTMPQDSAIAIATAMRKAEAFLYNNKEQEYGFKFEYDDNSFVFRIPGNACFLATYGMSRKVFANNGKTLSGHNIDHRTHQIEFLVGLATLSDLFEASRLSSS